MIRPASHGDAPAVAAIAGRAYAGYVERIGRRPAPMDADYEALVAAGRVFVCDVDGAVAAFFVLVPRDDHLLIENVAVEPERQGQGLGRSLLAFAEEEARRLGLAVLRLYTNEAMVENIALYRRLGWTEVGRRVDSGFHRVHFELRIV